MKRIKLNTEEEVQAEVYRHYDIIYQRPWKRTFDKIHLNNYMSYRLFMNCFTRINRALNKNKKSMSFIELLGCSIDQLQVHLESKFKPGMTWDNYGTGFHGKGMQEWHIDHIIPCCKFDLSKPSEQRKCFHYTNLRPLWATENITKRNTIDCSLS